MSRADRGREAVEGMLTLLAYIAYSEYCSIHEPKTSLFKGLAHRSAGPLWNLLKGCMPHLQKRGVFCQPLTQLFESNVEQIDFWISQIANTKHGKKSAVDYVTFLGILGNCLAKVFKDSELGSFESVTAKRHVRNRFEGLFRSFRGAAKVFTRVYSYEGDRIFSGADVFLINRISEQGINLSPLYIWGLDSTDGDTDLYEYDTFRKDTFGFRAIQFKLEKNIDENGELKELWQFLQELRNRDSASVGYDKIHLKSYEVDTTEAD